MIRDHLMPTINKAFTSKAISTMTKQMSDYVDRNSEVLMVMSMSERYSFADKDREVIYTALGVTEPLMEQEIKESKNIYSGNKIQSNPFYCACILAIHALLKQKKPMEKEAKMVMIYMSLMMYTSMHKGFFKYGANKQVMDYTLSHLDKSFRIRSMTSLYAFLVDNAETTFDTYKDRIIKCDDNDITWIVNALWDRLKGKMRKLSNLYYENNESGNYLNADSESINPEDYHQLDSTSFMIDRLSNKIYIKLLNHQFDSRFLKYAITRSDTSLQKLKNLVDDIIQGDSEGLVRQYISANIEYYLLTSGRGFEYIPRGEFISYMKSAYASNTESSQMAYIKTQLDSWLSENMISAGRTNYGKTAKLGYKKSLYMFFVFVINQEAKIST